MADNTVHHFQAGCSWTGSTGAGYDAYDRAHDVSAADADQGLRVSADSAFRGDALLLNPEQLLLTAAMSCQLLSFLAVAARSRIDVVAYEDEASAVMPEDDPPMRITRIELRPRITIAGDVGEERVRRMVELAHKACFIANSLKSEITVEPTIVFRSV